ncbi:MAG: amidohydrolase [Cyclobacteriaceae bacterium]
MKPSIKTLTFFFLLLFLTSCQTNQQSADLIVINANIWTGDQGQPRAEAMAILGDTILAIGTSEDLDSFMGEKTRVMDAGGKFITPGFIDTHVHFLSGSYGLSSVKLRDAATPEEFSSRIGNYAGTVAEGTWIMEGDWDHQLWGGELPRAEWIDPVTSNHPVFVTRLDGHISLANSKAMELAGVDKSTPDIEGGEIVRDANGNPTGIFKDNAQGLIYRAVTPFSAEQNDEAIINGMNYMVSNGVTTVHNMDLGASTEIIDTYGRIRDRQIIRFYMAVGLSNWTQLRDKVEKEGRGDKWLKIGVLKGMVDGALGSHTAAFFEPFTDTPGDRGFFVVDEDSLNKWAMEADKANLQLAIHAIGDRAINTLLNVFEKVANENGPRDRRFRIEHVQHLSPSDISRFDELGVIASVQPYHAIDDGRWAEKVIGSERIKTTYAFKSLLDANTTVAFGSDWAVAPPTPLEGIYAATTRRTLDGANPEGWVPEQKITVEEALRAYTINGAYSSFDENVKGKLAPGMLADFVILSEDLTKVDPVQINAMRVLQTYVGGKKVFDIDDE